MSLSKELFGIDGNEKLCFKCKKPSDGYYLCGFHRNIHKEYCKNYVSKNRDLMKRRKSDRYKSEPWIRVFDHAYQRYCKRYEWYIPLGLLFEMTRDDFKELWIRDNADKLKRPSIDRIDGTIGYVKSNCRIIEFLDNIRRKRTFNRGKLIIRKDIFCQNCNKLIVNAKKNSKFCSHKCVGVYQSKAIKQNQSKIFVRKSK